MFQVVGRDFDIQVPGDRSAAKGLAVGPTTSLLAGLGELAYVPGEHGASPCGSQKAYCMVDASEGFRIPPVLGLDDGDIEHPPVPSRVADRLCWVVLQCGAVQFVDPIL